MLGMFDKQEGALKYSGLVDCKTGEEFVSTKTQMGRMWRGFNPSRPKPGQRKKIKLNFYFNTSLWYLKRFYEGLYDGLYWNLFWGVYGLFTWFVNTTFKNIFLKWRNKSVEKKIGN